MATELSALLIIAAAAKLEASEPHTGAVDHNLGNGAGGRRWINGQQSGQVDRVYLRSSDLAAGGGDLYNLKAAGQLTDIYGQDLDLGELKGILIRCISGEIRWEGHASNAIPFFNANGDAVILSAGQSVAVDFGAVGLDVSSNSQFHIHENTSAAPAEYKIWLIGANA